jgi:hypothetical protein
MLYLQLILLILEIVIFATKYLKQTSIIIDFAMQGVVGNIVVKK